MNKLPETTIQLDEYGRVILHEEALLKLVAGAEQIDLVPSHENVDCHGQNSSCQNSSCR